ncbi:MAG: hypothetical protein LBG75_00145 [Candidatus Nomurabacteria bacterium]|jgi:hypothetical protein|nr:hypothetical protein [Candidatus Nomurabacteria bacterium]
MKINSTSDLVEALKDVGHKRSLLLREVKSPVNAILVLAKDWGAENAKYDQETHEKESKKLLSSIKSLLESATVLDRDFARYREDMESRKAIFSLDVELGEYADMNDVMQRPDFTEDELARFAEEEKIAEKAGVDKPYENYFTIWNGIKELWPDVEWLYKKFVVDGYKLAKTNPDGKVADAKPTDSSEAVYTLAVSGNGRTLFLNEIEIQRLNYGSNANKIISAVLNSSSGKITFKDGIAKDPASVIKNLKIPKKLKEVMFNVSKKGLAIKNPVTENDLKIYKVDKTEIDKEIKTISSAK